MIILKITLVIQIHVANTSLGWFDFHLSVKIKLREVMTHNRNFFLYAFMHQNDIKTKVTMN